MAKKRSDSNVRKIIIKKILEAATKFKKAPYEIKASEFWAVNNGAVTDWQVRKLGGFTGIRELEYPVPKEVSIRKPHQFIGVQARLTNFTKHIIKPEKLFKNAGLKKDEVFRMLVMPDTHVPEHDPAAVEAFMQFGEWYKPHGLINLGDFMEMDAVSHWPAKDLRPRRLVPHVKRAQEILQEIDNRFGKQLIFKYFLIGNHEDWLDQYLIAKAPEIFDGINELGMEFSIAKLLDLEEKFNYNIIPLNEILSIGDHCHFIHGYYTNRYHANKHLDVFGVNIYYGHLHDVQSMSTVSVKGVHEAMSLGCLRDLNAPFLKGVPNNWSHAFGIFEFCQNGEFTRYVPIIVEGKFSFAGQVFNGNAKQKLQRTIINIKETVNGNSK